MTTEEVKNIIAFGEICSSSVRTFMYSTLSFFFLLTHLLSKLTLLTLLLTLLVLSLTLLLSY